MSIDLINTPISCANPNIIDYLIRKLESRVKNLSNCRNIFNSIDSLEAFFLKRKEVFLLFDKLEEEFKQALYAIKALSTQNKALSQESNNIKQEMKNFNILLNENNHLKLENNSCFNKINELLQENRLLQSEKKKMNKPKISANKSGRRTVSSKSIQKNQSNKKKTTISKSKSRSKSKTSHSPKKVVKKNTTINNDNYEQIDYNSNDAYQLKNVKNIMKGIKRNKLKLKEVIDEHLGKSKMSDKENKENFCYSQESLRNLKGFRTTNHSKVKNLSTNEL